MGGASATRDHMVFEAYEPETTHRTEEFQVGISRIAGELGSSFSTAGKSPWGFITSEMIRLNDEPSLAAGATRPGSRNEV